MALPRRMMNSRRRMEPTPTLSREANVACREHYQTSPQMACYGNPASTPRLRARACTHPFVAGITAAVIGVDTAFHSLAFSPTGRRSETPCIPNAEKPKRLREGGLFRKMLVLRHASLILRHWVGGSVQSLGRVGVSASAAGASAPQEKQVASPSCRNWLAPPPS